MIPWIGRLHSKPRRPKHHLVLILHAIVIVVFIYVVSDSIIVMIPWSYGEVEATHIVECVSSSLVIDQVLKLERVGYSVSIPIIVRPVHYPVIVVVPSALFLTCEASREKFLGCIRDSVVVIVWIFPIRDPVIVIVDIVILREKKGLPQDSFVPYRLINSVSIRIRVQTIIICILAIVAYKVERLVYWRIKGIRVIIV